MESSRTRDWTHVPCFGRRILNHWATREVQFIILKQVLQINLAFQGRPLCHPTKPFAYACLWDVDTSRRSDFSIQGGMQTFTYTSWSDLHSSQGPCGIFRVFPLWPPCLSPSLSPRSCGQLFELFFFSKTKSLREVLSVYTCSHI